MGKKRKRAAWNRFADLGRTLLVGTATLLPAPNRPSPRVNAGMCLFGIHMITNALKMVFPERRPDGEDNESFPSEHAAQCTAAALIIEREYGLKFGAVASGLATAVSLSRIESKKHHPRDVLAGALIGAGTVWIAIRFRRAVEHRLAQIA